MTSLVDQAGALFSRHAADQAGAILTKRRQCSDGYYRRCCSRWDCFGRWIFAAVAVFVCFLIFFLWACMRTRRRRQQGVQPMYGTGWMAGGQPYQNNPNGYYQQPPPPAYGAPPAHSYPMNNYPNQQPSDGYYGQREGVQPPKNVYTNEHAHQDAYAAPEGPPPNKVVR